MTQPQLVQTIKERCRVCYTCVRECPVKAIRIAEGQAEVLHERCIGCGNCVRVCSQHAKQVLDGKPEVRALLAGQAKVAAILAPSFPAEFADGSGTRVISAVRGLGFELVGEVGAGADLVARAYSQLMATPDRRHYIATTCPAIVAFVERYHPELIDSLVPIVSPMVAAARALRELHGADLRVVFIGPCIAKKGEAASGQLPGDVDGVLTFGELRDMLTEDGIDLEKQPPGQFDPPHAGPGALLAISRGLLQAADLREDLISGEVVAAEGRLAFAEAIKEFQDGDLDARLLEVLCCQGCIMGAGMTSTEPLFSRRTRVRQYVRERLAQANEAAAQALEELAARVDLSRTYASDDQRIPVPFEEEVSLILAKMGKSTPEDELNCGACGYDTCREHAVAIFKGLAESEMCLPYAIEQLRRTVKELAVSHEQLASAQEALMQSEKLASMGQLAAGIAHEVNNPLGVVLMYAHLLKEACGQNPELQQDVVMIVDQADRCKKIVSGLLHFARQNKLVLQRTDLAQLVDRSLRVLHPPTQVDVVVEHEADTQAELDADQIVQVLTNLVSNAYAAMEKGGTLTVCTGGDEQTVRMTVSDTGVGIAQENLSKIFEPFYTTKQMGKGTGLGLAVTYGIVKMHSGDIKVRSNADPTLGPTGTTFTVALPRRQGQE